MSRMQKSHLILSALALVAITPASVFATAIPLGGGGVLNLANLQGGVVGVSTTPTPCIAFSGNTATCNGTTGDAVSGTDPIFGLTGTIKDFVSAPVTAFETVNLTIAGGPAIFDLVSVMTPSGFPACTITTNSGSCTTGSFVLTQSSPGQVTINLNLNLLGYLGSSGTGSTPYIGVFTTQLSGGLAQFGCAVTVTNDCTDTVGNVIQFEGANGVIKSTWSATESPVTGVPEPTSFILLGSGLLVLGMVRRTARRS